MNQTDLNEEMLNRGKDRYTSNYNDALSRGQFSTTQPGQRLISSTIIKVVNQINEFKKEQSKIRAGNQTKAYGLLKDISSKTLSFIALKRLMDISHKRATTHMAYKAIGTEVYNEVRIGEYKKQFPKDYKAARNFSRKAGVSHRQKFLILCLNKHEVEVTKWGHPEILAVGAALFSIVKSVLNFFQVIQLREGKKTINMLAVSEELINWVSAFNKNNEFMKPDYMPMLDKPTKWEVYDKGGTPEDLPNYNLVANRDHKYIKEDLSKANLSQVFSAVNIIQETRWRINENVFKRLTECFDRGIEVGKLNSVYFSNEPKVPSDIETNQESRRAYRAERNKIIKDNLRVTSKRYSVARTLSIAKQFIDKPAFYLPCELDFRGRVYPKAAFLHPQGSDPIKSLLEFSDGEKIETQDQANWLAFHGANAYGLSKETISERIAFIENNEDLIRDTVNGSSSDWMEADKPWEFLAFCYEWVEFKRQGFGFKTHLPVSVDGANNGSQILSLLARDRDGCKATNVTAVDKPQDIYQEVADEVIQLLNEADPEDHIIEILKSHFEITRKTVKKQTMTIAYSATFFSCRDYTKAWMQEELDKARIKLAAKEFSEAGHVLAKFVWEAINRRMGKQKEVMAWLQECCSLLVENNFDITWTTPLGLPVKQKYQNMKKMTIDLTSGDRIQVRYLEELPTPNKGKHKSGISPNYVHSLDAAALQLTTILGAKLGITNFMLVHDSFGTLCTKMDELSAAIRTAYYKIFSEDQLGNLRQNWQARTGLSLPEVPHFGDMNVDELLDSEYFFC
jgi:DNA-directed RNA polymerase